MNLNIIAASTVEGVVSALNGTIARINTVWGKEHQADGRHARPKWISVTSADMGASNFFGTGAQTWTVNPATFPAGNLYALEFWKDGDCYELNVDIRSTTVGGTPSTLLAFRLPGGFTPKSYAKVAISLTDNAATVPGFMFVQPNEAFVYIQRADGAVFTGGSTLVQGQIQLRTTA